MVQLKTNSELTLLSVSFRSKTTTGKCYFFSMKHFVYFQLPPPAHKRKVGLDISLKGTELYVRKQIL